MQNGSSVGTCARCTHVSARLEADLYAQSLLSNKISALELTWKLIKSALLVGIAKLEREESSEMTGSFCRGGGRRGGEGGHANLFMERMEK